MAVLRTRQRGLDLARQQLGDHASSSKAGDNLRMRVTPGDCNPDG